MRDLLLMAVLAPALPLAFLRPWIGVLLWVWVGTMSPHKLSWELQHVPLAMIVGSLTLAGLVFSLGELRLPRPRGSLILMSALWGWTLVTTTFARVPTEAWEAFSENSKKFLFVFLSILLFQDLRRLRWLVAVVAGSIGFYGIKGAVFSVLGGGRHRVYGPPASEIYDNNDLALALNMVIPLLIFLAASEKRTWARFAWGFAALCSIVTVIFTYSRGGFIGLAAILFVMALKSKHRSAVVALGVIVLVAALVLAPPAWTDRIESIGAYEEDASVQGRFDAWGFAWNLAVDRPVVGGGFGAFHPDLYAVYRPDAARARAAHSIYFDVLGTQGFVGLLLFVALLGTALWRTEWLHRRLKRRGATWFGGCIEAVQYSMLAYMVSGAFLGRAWFDLYYQLVGVLIVVDALSGPILEIEAEPAAQPEGRELAPCAA